MKPRFSHPVTWQFRAMRAVWDRRGMSRSWTSARSEWPWRAAVGYRGCPMYVERLLLTCRGGGL